MKSKLSHYPYSRPQYEWDKIRLEETFGEYYEKYNTEEVENPYIYEEKNGVEGEQYYRVDFKNESKLWASSSNTATYKTWDEESGSKSQWLGDLFNTETEKTNIQTHEAQANIKGDYFSQNKAGNLLAWSGSSSPWQNNLMPLKDSAYINTDSFKPYNIDLTKLYKDIGLQLYNDIGYYCIPFNKLAKKEHDLIKNYIEGHEGSIEVIDYIDQATDWKEKLTIKYYYPDTRDNEYMPSYIIVSFYFVMIKNSVEPNGYYFEGYNSIQGLLKPQSVYTYEALYPNENGEYYGIISNNMGQEEALKENYNLYGKRWNELFTFEEEGSIDKSYIINKNYLPTPYKHTITPYTGTPDKYLDVDNIVPMYKEYVYEPELKEYEERFNLGNTTSRLVLDKVLDCVLTGHRGNIVIDNYFYEYHNEDSDLKYLNENLEFNIGETTIRRPREFGYKIGHYDEMEVIEYIYNEKKNYLSHNDIIDTENLILQRYAGVATTIVNQFELGPKDLLSNISYTKTVNDSDSIDFTTVASASITAQLNYPVEEANKLVGQNFTYLLDYGDGKWHNMGLFTIDEAESIDPYTSRIIGHDHMYRLNKYVDDFIANYTYPTTLKRLWYDLLDYCDIFHGEEEISGINADLVLNRNFEAVKTSALQIAEYITQLMAGYAHINKDNFSATISHYESVPVSIMPSNYNDISHSPYDSQVPNQIKIGYNNDKTVSTSDPINRYYKEDVSCAVIDNSVYREVIDSVTYRYPDGAEITFSGGAEIKRNYDVSGYLELTPVCYSWDENRCFGMLYAPRSEDTFFITFKEIVNAHEAQNITMEYLDTKILPEKAKAVYNGNGSPYISSVNYYDTNNRLYAKWFTNDEVHYYVDIYDYLEDLEEINKISHREAISYHFEFKVKDYTYRVDGKPLNEINTDIDTGKYIIHINNGNAKAQEYGYRLDTEFIPYYITDNALITYNTDENECKRIMANICEVLKELPLDYRKCDLTMLIPTENYEIKIGDIIEVTNKIGKKFKMMVMEISIDSSGITYSSFGEMNYPVEGDNITSQIIYLEDTRRELNNVIDDMGYVAEDLININDKFDEVDNSINNLNSSISNTDNKLNNYITTNNNRVDALGEAVNGTAQSIIDLSNLTKEFKSTASNDGLATINLTNTLTGVVLDSRLQAQTTALLNAINGKCGIVYMTHDDNENIPQKGYALNIGNSDLYISICNFDLSSTMTVSTVYLYFFIIMNNKIISRGRFNAMN